MKQLIWLIAVLWLLLPAPAHAVSDVQVRYVGAPTLEELIAGAAGTGTLLYERDGRVLLAVQLTKAAGATSASAAIYDVPAGTDAVPLLVEPTQVRFPARSLPAVTITSLDGWWLRDDRPSANLDILVRGQVYAMWGGAYERETGPAMWTARVQPGEPAVKIEARDPHGDGVALYEYRDLLPAFPGRAYIRSNYAERRCARTSRRDAGISPAWPFIGDRQSYEQRADVQSPPVIVDWNQGRITHVAELVTARHQSCAYVLYSISPLVRGQHNTPNFESPFAFYTLSETQTGLPDLVLRTERYPAGDPISAQMDGRLQQGRRAPRELQVIRYSWREDGGDASWDSKVEVYGYHTYTGTTRLADGQTTVDAPEYAAFPSWVARRSWPAVTFVDTETERYVSTEGIYDWSPRDIGLAYLFGWSIVPQRDLYATIKPGLRGEYRFTRDLPVQLYLSGIDGRLHLRDAEHGVWQLDDQQQIRLSRIGDTPYLNSWQRVAADGTTHELLAAVDGHLLTSGPTGLLIRRARYDLAQRELPLPQDAASLAELRAIRAAQQHDLRAPDNLRAWVDRFTGPSVVIDGARIRHVEQQRGVLRAVIDILPQSVVRRSDLFKIPGAGQYVIQYDGAWSIVPLGDTATQVSVTTEPLIALQASRVLVTITRGGVGSDRASVELLAGRPAAELVSIARRETALPADEPVDLVLGWAPPDAGPWRLVARVSTPEDNSTTAGEVTGTAQPTNATYRASLRAPEVLLVLVGALLIGVTSTAAGWRDRRRQHG